MRPKSGLISQSIKVAQVVIKILCMSDFCHSFAILLHPVFRRSHPQVVSGSHGHTICPCIMYHYSCSLKIKQRIHQNQGQSDWKGARISMYSLNNSSLHTVAKAQYHTKTMYISMRLQRKLHNNK
jgi:hypothetical protein